MTPTTNDDLDRLFDDLVHGRAGAPLEQLGALLTEDPELPSPDVRFVASLRDELLRRHDARPTSFERRSLGIVAPAPARPLNRRLTALAAAAAILAAVVTGGLNWDRIGHPAVNVATAQATIAWTPTPTAIPTVTPQGAT